MVILLATVAFLLYRWSTVATAGVELRLGTELEAKMMRWHLDLYGEFSAVCVALQVGPDSGGRDTWSDFFERYAEWSNIASNHESPKNIYQNPDLVENIYIWETSQKTKPRLLVLNADKKRLHASDVPKDLQALLARLQANSASLSRALRAWESPDMSWEQRPWRNDTSGADSLRGSATTGWQFDENIPALVHPILRHSDTMRHSDPDPPSSQNPVDWIVVVLRRDTIQQRIFPELAKRYFGSGDRLEYKVAVIATGETSHAMYSSDPGFGIRDGSAVDSTMNIFGPPQADVGWQTLNNSQYLPTEGWRNFTGPVWFPTIEYGSRQGQWVLVLQRRADSLQAMIIKVKQRNLAFSILVLALLAINVGFVMAASFRAQRFARLQMDFVASVSHELRTPLTAMFCAGENIKDGLIREKSSLEDYGSMVISQARRLMDHVDRILLFASIRSGKDRYTLRPLQVSEILQRVRKNTAGLISEGRCTVEEQEADGLPSVLGDLSAVCGCLENLIANAVKYSRRDRRIRISAALHAVNNHEKEVWISIEDHGIGISSSDLKHAFEPFYRSPEVTAAQIYGTGLGLPLAKHLAEAMGGRISVTSEVGVGSVFTLHLAAAQPQESDLSTVNSRINEVMIDE
jgi:signal transduction histidine kinase